MKLNTELLLFFEHLESVGYCERLEAVLCQAKNSILLFSNIMCRVLLKK